MALLGNLSVSILGDLSGYSKALTTAQKESVKFAKNTEKMGKNISTIGYGFQDLGQNLTNKITKPALVAAGAIVGMVGALGFKRLVSMDNAQAKLKGLGIEGKQLEIVMGDVNKAVTGTTHTMAEGADTAAGALAAGVKEGAELERYIKLVGDAAMGSNKPMDEMAMIFNRVQGSGKLMTRELNMIEMGMPGFSQAMAKHVGADSLDAFGEMVTAGEIGSDEFLDVMGDFAGGMSEAMAGTWSGMAKNVVSNIGIIGESLLDGVFQDGKKAIADFLEVLRSDGLREWATETGEKIRELAQTIVDKVTEMKAKWDELSAPMQDIIKKVALFGGIFAIAIGPALLIVGKLIVFIGDVVARFGIISGAVAKLGGVMGILTGPVGIVIGIIVALIAVGVLLYKNWDKVKEKAVEVFSNFAPLLDVVKGAFQKLKDSLGPIMENLKNLWDSLVPILEKVGMIIAAIVVPAFGILVAVFNGVVSAIGPIINALINFVDFVVNMVNAIVALFMGDFAGAWDFLGDAAQSSIDFFVNLFDGLLSFVMGFVDAIVGFFHGLYMTLVGNSIIPDMVNAIVEWFQNMFQWVIDIVNNIVEGAVQLFELLLDRITTVFEAVWDIIVAVWDYIMDTFQNALDFILALVTLDFEGMKNAINNQMENAKTLLSKVWEGIKVLIGKKATEILTDIISKFVDIKNNMQNKINEAKNAVVNKFTEIVSGVGRKASEIVTSVKTKFNEAKDAITKPIDEAKSKVSDIIDDIKGFFSGLKLKLPKISMPKMPKFSLTGSFSLKPPSVPKIGVNWNAAGGVFTKPTVLNTAAGLQGFGEVAGESEAILPLNSKVLGGIGKGIADTLGFGGDDTIRLLSEQNQLLAKLLNKDTTLQLNGKEVGRAISDVVDEELNTKGNRRSAAFGG